METIDNYHAHEALDRTYLVMDMVEIYLLDHPYISSDIDLKEMLEEVSDKLMKVYQLIGQRHL